MQSQRLTLLKDLLSAQPNDSFLLFALAKEYEKLNDTDAALATWLQLLHAHPDYVGMYYHLGKLYESLNQTENAIKTYRDGMKQAKNAGDMHAFSELAGAKLNLADDDE